ncbi:MAG: dihydrodipicolinate synthase family protein [Alphaproteobacteria bacterium]
MSDRAGDACPVALRGIVPSLNTPFTAADKVDVAGLCRLVDHVVASGCAGMLALAVAGEAASLSAGEADLVAETVVGHAAGRLPVILSVTADDQAERCRRAARARALGADGVLCQPPAGVGAADRLAMLRAVGAAGPDLLMIQDLDWHGPGLPIAEIVDLFERIPAVRCLKVEVVPAGPKYSAVLAATGGRLHVGGGWAVSQMMDALARGVHAFMPTAMESVYVAIHRHHAAGREAEARRLFEAVLPVLAFANQHIDVSIRFLKQLRLATGVFATDRCRPPVPDFDPVQQREADRLIDRVTALERDLSAAP